MFLRLVVSIATLFAGIPAAGIVGIAASPRVGTSVVATTAASTPVSTSSSSVAPDKPMITDRDVVVPPADPAGDAVATPGGLTAQSTNDRIVTDERGGQGRLESAVVETGAFQTLGLTWPTGTAVTGLGAQVRTRVDGVWSGWQPLTSEDSGPDAGTVEGMQARSGTDPVWVGDADAVQLSFAATAGGGPAGLKLALVSSPATPAATVVPSSSTSGTPSIANAAYVTSATTGATAGTGTTALTAEAPKVITRAEWGAAPQACAPDVATGLVGAVVHHTADSNAYSTIAQAEQQIRNDQAYHINTLGWCDIGYNFLVDKWGNIYEGRANSMVQPVVGAHAGGFNTGTVGVAMLGTYSTVVPSVATQESVAEVIAWRLSQYGVNPSGTMSYTTGGGSDKYAAGTTVTIPVVTGHRDVYLTACPGDTGYSTLPAVRARATALAYSVPMVKALYHDMLQRDVDPSGLQTWTAQLNIGVAPSALADTLARSQEYVQRCVAAAYQEILHRAPDPTGFASWTGWILSGSLRVEDLRGQLIASNEYYRRAGGTDQTYVAQLYRDILHREAAPSEIAGWVTSLRTVGRPIASFGVWRSLESAQLRVNEIYQVFLDRAADPSGIATWSPYWQAHGEDALRGMIVGSGEYGARSIRLF